LDYNSGLPSSFIQTEAVEESGLRHRLTEYGVLLKQKGLTSATGGNMSHRLGGDMLLSPTGHCLDEVFPEDWVRVNLVTAKAYPEQVKKPSSEVLMHRNIYLLRPDINAIIHSHPPHVIALSLVGITIRPIGSEAPFLLEKSSARPVYYPHPRRCSPSLSSLTGITQC
jgi:L-fuculose-phosphate aldolase